MSITSALPRSSPSDDEVLGKRVLSKVAWRLIPLLGVLYIFNILDRVNVGFAALTMQRDLDISTRVFDFGYGLFYVGYILFEVPSNLLLRRFGARKLIARGYIREAQALAALCEARGGDAGMPKDVPPRGADGGLDIFDRH